MLQWQDHDMNRRSFLAAGTAALIGGPSSLAQAMEGMQGMPMHHHGGAATPTGSSVAIPEGRPLRELPRLENLSSQPRLFEARLTAEQISTRIADGLDTEMLAYNGSSPGPLIEAQEGDRVTLAFENRVPDQASTIHWHGMPVPADQDGNPMDAVEAGSGRTYSFVLPEGSAGTYWYHPHPHETTAEQVYRGLAGSFVVRSRTDPIPAAYGDTPLFLTDLRLAADGSMPASTSLDMMNGRVGDHVLVNGRKKPVLAVGLGSRRRFRLFNAMNARFLRLAFDNAAMTVIGTEGGLLEAPVAVEEILLSPGERLEIVVAFDRPGGAALRTLDYDRGWMGPGQPDDAGMTLMSVDVDRTREEPMPPLPAALRVLPPLGDPATRRRFVLSEAMTQESDGIGMSFFINGATFDMSRVDIVSKVGQVELWEIVNQADMDHPFHVHGTQFEVVEREQGGRVSKPDFRALKDTINVARGETVRILLRQNLPGLRMYHCHILEHEQLGMMGVVDVRA
jgi:FtsP/CotA-like multicopper oxidase with cupredoxin domain